MSAGTAAGLSPPLHWWRRRQPRLPPSPALLDVAAVILPLGTFLALGRLYSVPVVVGLDEAGLRLAGMTRSPWLDQAITLLSMLGSELLWMVWLPAGAVLLVRRRIPSVVALAVVVGGVHWWNDVLKTIYQRARPVEFGSGAQAFSFPSGHAMAAGAVFGLLALLAWRELRGRPRVAAALTCTAMAVLVALTRPYLGVHYPSDVLAGLMAGLLWADLVVLGWRLSALAVQQSARRTARKHSLQPARR